MFVGRYLQCVYVAFIQIVFEILLVEIAIALTIALIVLIKLLKRASRSPLGLGNESLYLSRT